MNWQNLKELKCPECYGDLTKVKEAYTCEVDGFRIGLLKLEEVVTDMFKNQKEKDDFYELCALDD